ncbi:MAG: 1-deoxy-D-xylulose-5-phosphate reductoisomerase [Eggerthellaceae bacterium]
MDFYTGQRKIVILGSTGSIGRQTLDVVRQHPDKLRVVGLAAHHHASEVLAQAEEFGVSHVAFGSQDLAHESVADDLHSWVRKDPNRTCTFGKSALLDLVHLPEADLVVNALVGAAGLEASYETLQAEKVLALANKESLVVGGDLIMPLAAHTPYSLSLMPIDSEHGAVFQCLIGEQYDEVNCLWITASGGPFRGKKRADLIDVTPEEALAHPTWNMGAKISIDSATLMNKGLEVIEAHHLFQMPYDRIRVVVQPQSAIHSMVEFIDGSVKAHLGTTDMRIPIQFALSYPERWTAPVESLDFRKIGSLDFDEVDTDTFRCFSLAREAGERGGTLPCAMNAANEVAVAAFLQRQASFLGIADCVAHVMDAHQVEPVETLEQLIEIDAWARKEAHNYLGIQS